MLCLSFSGRSQINTPTWGVEDTSFCIIKSTNFGIVHDYLELYNYAATDLQMRWVAQVSPDWPVQWEAGFSDPDSVYSNVLIEDSADFILPYPVAFSNKLILDVDHNNHLDTSYIRFKVFPVSYPADTLWLNYCVIITSPDVSVDESYSPSIQFDPVTNQLIFENALAADWDLLIYSLSGTTEMEKKISAGSYTILLPELPTGFYLIQLMNKSTILRKKIVIL